VPELLGEVRRQPCVVEQTRGLVKMELEMMGPKRNVHSSRVGGLIHEPLNDLVRITAALTEKLPSILNDDESDEDDEAQRRNGKNAAKKADAKNENSDGDESEGEHERTGTNARAPQHAPAPANAAAQNGEQGDGGDDEPSEVEIVREELGVVALVGEKSEGLNCVERNLKNNITIHGFEGGYSGPSTKAIIPHSVSAKLSIQSESHLDTNEISQKCSEFLEEKFTSFQSSNSLVILAETVPGWTGSPESAVFEAALIAQKKLYKVPPEIVRSGMTHNMAACLETILKAKVVIVPMSGPTDAIVGENEKIEKSELLKYTVFCVMFMNELARGFTPEQIKATSLVEKKPGLSGMFKGLFKG